jgi:hypothetical protein
MNSALFTLSLTQIQGDPPRFASLSTVLVDPSDRAGNRRRKAGQQLCHILVQFDGRAEEILGAIDEWASVHLGGASEEIRAWVGGARAMLSRRRRLIEQIFTLLDTVDETFDEEALREEMVRTLVDLAEREPAGTATNSDHAVEDRRNPPASAPVPSLATSASPNGDHR